MGWDIENTKIGKKVFTPQYKVGGYIEVPYLGEINVEQKRQISELLELMADCGMDHSYQRINSESTTGDFLIGEHSDNNLKIILESNDSEGDAGVIDTYGSHIFCAILNYDDQENRTLQECEDRYVYLKDSFPELPVYSTGYRYTPESSLKRGWADIVAQQNYPTGQNPIVSHSAEVYEQGRIPGKPFLANCQCFVGYENHFPTPNEVYAMGLLALIYCDAITWYTFWDSSYNILDYPEHWAMVAKLTKEIRLHENTFLYQTKNIVVDGEHVHCTWSDGLVADVKNITTPRVVGVLQ
jgi:hypothetical protein